MPMMLVSDPILSPQDNKCNSIYSSLCINDGGGRCYIYIYICMYIYIYIYKYVHWHNSFVILLILLFVMYVYSILYGWMMGTYCLSPSILSPAIDCYIWWVWYIQWNDNSGRYFDNDDDDAVRCQSICWICFHVHAHPFPQG